MSENYATFEWTFDVTFSDGKPISKQPDSRNALVSLLEQASLFDAWTFPEPEIKLWEDVTEKTRHNTTEPTIYVHRSDSDNLERFSAAEPDLTEEESLRLSIWVLKDINASEFNMEFNAAFGEHGADFITRQYRNDLLGFLQGFMQDNYANTAFESFEPDTSTDFRPQRNARRTEHYIYTIEVDTHRLVAEF